MLLFCSVFALCIFKHIIAYRRHNFNTNNRIFLQKIFLVLFRLLLYSLFALIHHLAFLSLYTLLILIHIKSLQHHQPYKIFCYLPKLRPLFAVYIRFTCRNNIYNDLVIPLYFFLFVIFRLFAYNIPYCCKCLVSPCKAFFS